MSYSRWRSKWYEKMEHLTRKKGMPVGFPYHSKGFAEVMRDKSMSNIAKFHWIWPLPWNYHLGRRIAAEKVPLDILRKQIIMARAEYWYRKIATYPQVWAAAKAEWTFVMGKVKDPLSITGHNIIWSFGWAFQVVGAFIIGEMIGRKNIYGYGMISPEWQPSNAEFHFSPITW
eukprot:114746_1